MQLLEKHQQLVKEIGLEEMYSSLLRNIPFDFLGKYLPSLPRVLIAIIHDYLAFDWGEESEDVETVYESIDSLFGLVSPS